MAPIRLTIEWDSFFLAKSGVENVIVARLYGCGNSLRNDGVYGKTRIVEAGKGNKETLIFLHGVGGHCEAYAKNVVTLSDEFHVVAYDYVGHGLSDKPALNTRQRF